MFGGVILGAAGAGDYVAAWIGLVVGAHFIPFAGLFGNPSMRVTGAVLMIAAVVAVVVNLSSAVVTSTVMGPVAGLVLAANAWAAIGRHQASHSARGQRPAGA